MCHIDLNFLSYYVKGMQPSKNCLKYFEYFKSKLKPSDLLFLQETHSTIDCGKDEFGGGFHFSHDSSSSRGVLVAFYGNPDIAIKKSCPTKKYESLL